MRSYRSNEIYFGSEIIKSVQRNAVAGTDQDIVYIGVPVVAYKIRHTDFSDPENIISQTVLRLKALNKSNGEIADMLCLDKRLINSIVEADRCEDTESGEHMTSATTQTVYIFFNRFDGKFMLGKVKEEDFKANTSVTVCDYGSECVTVKFEISQSAEYKVIPLDAKHDYPQAPTKEQMLVAGKFSDVRNVGSSKQYSTVENLNESSELMLVCPCYFDKNNLRGVSVYSPVSGRSVESLSVCLKTALENVSQFSALKSGIERLKKNAQARSENFTVDEAQRPAVKYLADRYGDNIKNTIAENTYKRMVYFEQAFIDYNAVANAASDVDCKDKISALQNAAHTALEEIFKSACLAVKDEVALYKAMGFVEKNSSRELLSAAIQQVGFAMDDEDKADKFLRPVTKYALKHAMEVVPESRSAGDDGKNAKKQKSVAKSDKNGNNNVALWFTLNVIYAAYIDGHPMRELATKLPNIISTLMTTLDMRNQASHGGQIRILTVDDCNALHKLTERVFETMLCIESVGSASAVQNPIRDRKAEVEMQVAAQLEGLKFRYNDLKRFAAAAYRALYEYNEAEFYQKCSNILEHLFKIYLYKLYDEALINKISADLPRDKDKLNAHINDLFAANGVGYVTHSKVNPQKVIMSREQIETCTLQCAMFLTVLLAAEKGVGFFEDSAVRFEELAELADIVSTYRGHANAADFSAQEEQCEQLLERIIKIITDRE